MNDDAPQNDAPVMPPAQDGGDMPQGDMPAGDGGDAGAAPAPEAPADGEEKPAGW